MVALVVHTLALGTAQEYVQATRGPFLMKSAVGLISNKLKTDVDVRHLCEHVSAPPVHCMPQHTCT